MILRGEWWDYKNTHIFEGFQCKNFSVAPFSTSKYHIFHIFKSCYYLFWFIKNRFQNHLKSTLFSKNRSQQKVEFLLCCMLSQLIGKNQFFRDFFSNINKQQKKDQFKMSDKFSILRRIFEFKFWSWMVSYRTVITWKVLRNIWSFIISPLNPRKYCENGLIYIWIVLLCTW